VTWRPYWCANRRDAGGQWSRSTLRLDPATSSAEISGMWAGRVSQFARCTSAGSASHEPLGRKHRRRKRQSPLGERNSCSWCRAAVRSTRPHLSSSGNARRQRRHCRSHERAELSAPLRGTRGASALSRMGPRALLSHRDEHLPRADHGSGLRGKGDSATGGACKVLASTRAVMCSSSAQGGRTPARSRCARYRGSRSLLPQPARQDATRRHLFRISSASLRDCSRRCVARRVVGASTERHGWARRSDCSWRRRSL
jgi:hypothetical protein